MTPDELKSILEQDYNRQNWLKALRDILHIQNIYEVPKPVELGKNDFDATAVELGYFDTAEGLKVGIYEVTVSPDVRLDRNKVGLRNLMRKVFQSDGDAAQIVFTHGETWRFTYASELTVVNKETGLRERRQTDPKRYTYIFGRNQHCRTAAERFAAIKASTDLFDNRVSLSEIEKAFSVDTLTKDFYRELSNWYFWALTKIEFPDDAEPDKDIRNSTNTIRLITRLIFVWFLKQKKLIPDELFEKDKIFARLNFIDKNNSTYYKAILQNLFFATLNQEMDKRTFRKEGQHYNITNLFRYKRYFKDQGSAPVELFTDIPFLNGGLFECLDKPHPSEKTPQGFEKIVRIDGFSDRDDNQICIPDYLFFGGAESVDLSEAYGDTRQRNLKVRGLIDILNSYNFTVEENTPLDIQVALDPELLGKVFENLLASYNPETKTTARKQTGSFYTPREIVHYMVDESLKAYLIGKLTEKLEMSWRVRDSNPIDTHIGTTPEIEEYVLLQKEALQLKVNNLLSYSDVDPEFQPNEVSYLIEAVDEIKVLDPACGSGAFPMGVLQQLVHILQKIDFDNRYWKTLQLKKAQQELQNAIGTSDADSFKATVNEIMEAFENNSNDYGRKLFLIENCIYGVDIQPIAVQIAKLRFFISLICEQDPNPYLSNLGIKPLPNLETKFVAANTLIGLDTSSTFKPDSVYVLEKQLEEVRHRHFNARTPETKRKYRERDKDLRNKIADNLKDVGFPTTSADQIASWNPYDQNISAPFFDKYWMFGIEEGFDVVIGNPPYGVSLKGVSRKIIEKNLGKVPDYEIYYYFIEVAGKLLKLAGIKSYIIPNTFLFNVFASNYRIKLLEHWSVKCIVDCTAFKIFDGATVYNAITIFSKNNSNNEKNIGYKPTEGAKDFIELSSRPTSIVSKEELQKNNQNWALVFKLNSEVLNLIAQLRIHNPLSQYFYVSQGYIPYRKSDLIKLYGLEKAKSIVENREWHSDHQVNDEYKQEIWGTNLSKYSYTKANSFIWYGKHLAGYIDLKFFNQTRLLIREITNPQIIACIVSEELVNDPQIISVIPKQELFDLKCLWAIMNSTLATFYHFNSSPKATKGAFPKILVEDIKKFPLPLISDKEQKAITKLVELILESKKKNQETSGLERRMDEIVYKLYELTYDEVKIIDPKFWLSENEYKEVKFDKS